MPAREGKGARRRAPPIPRMAKRSPAMGASCHIVPTFSAIAGKPGFDA
jgi:hypothetical protein